MNALLLTFLTLGGLYGPDSTGDSTGYGYSGESGGESCDACQSGHCRKHGHHKDGKWSGPMPQSCYQPAYGCYPGTRFMNRYPAFHGTYYRRPYNYRNVFDYPWHAEMHEPTSMFSFHTDNEQIGTPPAVVPVPVPAARQDNPLHRDIRHALGNQAPAPVVNASSSQLRTLRR